MRTAKALVRLRGCAGSPEPSLVAYVISTIISWAGSYAVGTIVITSLLGGETRMLALFSACSYFSTLSFPQVPLEVMRVECILWLWHFLSFHRFCNTFTVFAMSTCFCLNQLIEVFSLMRRLNDSFMMSAWIISRHERPGATPSGVLTCKRQVENKKDIWYVLHWVSNCRCNRYKQILSSDI